MISKQWRIKFFNWLGAGKLTLTTDKPKDYSVSTYTIGGGAGYNNLGGITLSPPQTQGPATGQTLTIKITPANGGSIISVAPINQSESLYIIADGEDFDRELGKIITVTKLKS